MATPRIEIPAPYNQLGGPDRGTPPRNKTHETYRRIRKATGQWPWEWLPPNYTPKVENWSYSCLIALAQAIEVVCDSGSHVSLGEFRAFLANRSDERQRQYTTEEQPKILEADCKLARDWISEKQCGEEAQNSEAGFDADTESVRRRTQVIEWLGNPHSIPERPHSHKRTRLETDIDSVGDADLKENSSTQDVDSDLEMDRIETSLRISINRKIQAVSKRTQETEAMRNLCSEEKDERQRDIEDLNVSERDRAHQQAVEAFEMAQKQLQEAETFLDVIARRVDQLGGDCSQLLHDTHKESAGRLTEAVQNRDGAQTRLQILEDRTKSYAETLERIATLEESMEKYDQLMAKDITEIQALCVKLAGLDILCSPNLHAVDPIKLESLCSSVRHVLQDVNGAPSGDDF